jgi:hypothetical protein
VLRCPVCDEVYSYGRMISHLCGGKTFFFGATFNERPHKYQWNCCTHPKTTLSDSIPNTHSFPTTTDKTKSSKLEFLSNEISSKILYPWNCCTNQNDVNLVLNLTISDRQLIYE